MTGAAGLLSYRGERLGDQRRLIMALRWAVAGLALDILHVILHVFNHNRQQEPSWLLETRGVASYTLGIKVPLYLPESRKGFGVLRLLLKGKDLGMALSARSLPPVELGWRCHGLGHLGPLNPLNILFIRSNELFYLVIGFHGGLQGDHGIDIGADPLGDFFPFGGILQSIWGTAHEGEVEPSQVLTPHGGLTDDRLSDPRGFVQPHASVAADDDIYAIHIPGELLIERETKMSEPDDEVGLLSFQGFNSFPGGRGGIFNLDISLCRSEVQVLIDETEDPNPHPCDLLDDGGGEQGLFRGLVQDIGREEGGLCCLGEEKVLSQKEIQFPWSKGVEPHLPVCEEHKLRACRELLPLALRERRIREEQVSGVEHQKRNSLVPQAAQIACFPGQTAKLVSFSPTELELTADIVGVDDGEPVVGQVPRASHTNDCGEPEEDERPCCLSSCCHSVPL